MLVNLNDILPQANNNGCGIASFNTFGIEYAKACITAAEELELPVILAINMDMLNYVAVDAYIAFLVRVAEQSSQQICVHLDHCHDMEQITQVMDAGIPSVMYDGSQLELRENIDNTAQIVETASKYNVSLEAELGSVPYHTGRDHIRSEATRVEQVNGFCRQSGCDALAVSIGNVHRLTDSRVEIDYQLLEAIEQQATVPLVIHGASGIRNQDIQRLATQSSVAKFNVGTGLRLGWYDLVDDCIKQRNCTDTLEVMQAIVPGLKQIAVDYMQTMKTQTACRVDKRSASTNRSRSGKSGTSS